MDPTNMLFIFSDQHSRRVLGCYGNSVVKTPHLDALAAKGTRFSDAYCNAPICVPSRASMATGRYVHDIGYWDNARPYYGAHPSWGHRLMDKGHRVTSIGKLHYRNTNDPNGFDEEIMPMHVIEGVGMLTIIRDPMPISRKFPLLVSEAGAGDNTYTDYDAKITEAAVKWLSEEAGTYRDKPWTLFVSLVCPHPPWLAPREFYDLYPHDKLPFPEAYGLDERPNHPAYNDFRRFFGIEHEFDEATVRKVRAAYYAMTSFLDHNIGLVLGALEDNGLTDNTRILYSSDHGESLGEKGLFSKCNMLEESVGVPMILAGPDIPQGKVVDIPVSLVDCHPTIIQAAGAAPHADDADLPGVSLFDLANGATPERTIIAEQHSAGAKSATFMLRKGKLKYVHHTDYPAQLFDLSSDPRELNDLADDPANRSDLEACEASLRAQLDPEEIDRRAKADQAMRIDKSGGQEEVVRKGSPGYTPAPGEKPTFI